MGKRVSLFIFGLLVMGMLPLCAQSSAAVPGKDYRPILSRSYAGEVAERFIRYVKITTTSDPAVETIPSTKGQWEFAKLLVTELKGLGISDITLTPDCFVIARVPASKGHEKAPTIGLICHMDTSSDVPAGQVKPRRIDNYDGKPVKLGSSGLILDPAEFEDLKDHIGDSIIVTDGTTLLGGDDKTGDAETMTMLHYFMEHPEKKHGPLEICFAPDEETGRGIDAFPVKMLKSTACYTIDGAKLGEIEGECFNAYRAKVVFSGVAVHPAIGRGKYVDATLMATDFVSMLPRNEAPDTSDGRQGYFAPTELNSSTDTATLLVSLRDFEREGMERRIAVCKAIAAAVQAKYPKGKVEISFEQQYLNYRDKLNKRPEVMANAFEAARRAGVPAVAAPARGGTDGAMITEAGIPTPNIYTGDYAFHSRYEWVSIADMVQTVDTLIELCGVWAE